MTKNKIPNTRYKSGFTIAELMIVVSVISIIASIGIVSYNSNRDQAILSDQAQIITQQLTNASAESKSQDGGYQWWMRFDNPTGGANGIAYLCYGTSYTAPNTSCATEGVGAAESQRFALNKSVKFTDPASGTYKDIVFNKATGLPASAVSIIISLVNGSDTRTIAVNADGRIDNQITGVVVNGVCGSANGVAVASAPSTNLCSAGTPSAVSGTGPWTWTCTGSGGGTNASCSAPLLTYTITASAGAGGSISPSGSVVVNSGTNQSFSITPNANYAVSSVTVDGVNQGAITSYTFTNVTTTHTISAAFAASTPNAPTIGTASDTGSGRAYNNGLATVTFTPSATGPAATSFTATSSPGGFTGTGTASPITVVGLQSATAYTFTVTANNAAGSSSPSAASNLITATTVPQAPTIGVATDAGLGRAYNNGLATVAFTDNATGGSAITGHTATASVGAFNGSGISPINVAGLQSATTYTFTVVASNANGSSVASAASNLITATTVPQAPTVGNIIQIGVGGQTPNVRVPYSANATGGSAITSFTASVGGHTNTGSSPIDVSAVAVGAYTGSVTATNANGTSAAGTSPNTLKIRAWITRSSATHISGATIFDGTNFVSLGTNQSQASSNVFTSPDGITWTQRSLPAYKNWSGIAFGGGNIVAIAIDTTSNNVAVSADHGVTWTAQSTGTGIAASPAIAYGNGVFVIFPTVASTTLWTSPNGTTWTARSGAVTMAGGAVAFGNGVFVAVNSNGNTNIAQTSSDGISWTARTMPISTQWEGISYVSGNTFAAVGFTPSGGVLSLTVSNDGGVTWGGGGAVSAASDPVSVASDGSSMIVAMGQGNKALYSSDGGTTTFAATDALGGLWQTTAYGVGRFASAGAFNGAVYWLTYE